MLCVALFAGYYIYQKGPDANYDLLNYHFFSGYAAATGRSGDDVGAASPPGFLNPYWNVFSYFVNSRLSFPWSAWVMALVQLLSLPLLVGILREIERAIGAGKHSVEGVLAISLCLLAPMWWSELGTSFFSSSTLPLSLAALWLVLRTLSGRGDGKAFWSVLAAGALVGLATGLKLTNAIVAVALPFAVLPWVFQGRFKEVIWLGLAYAIGSLVGFGVTAPWNLAAWQQWESPVFPLYNAIFESPYWRAENFRDMRWHFASFSEFFIWLQDVSTGTRKTLELQFSDPRIVAGLVLGLIAAMSSLIRVATSGANRQVSSRDAVTAGFLWYVGIAFVLWAVMFAYQRYLIPVELVLGFVIWILARQILTESAVRAVMLLMFAAILWNFQIPRWGNQPALVGTGPDRFGIVMPDELSSSPAMYLLSGRRTSYFLPFLHGDSVFLRTDLTALLAPKIRSEMLEHSELPVRLMTLEAQGAGLEEVARRFDVPLPGQGRWVCWRPRSLFDQLVVCEASPRDDGGSAPVAGEGFAVDFRSSWLGSDDVMGVSGLSKPAAAGRWSVGDEIVVTFARCLPQGEIEVEMVAKAFGPNTGRSVGVVIGESKAALRFSGKSSLERARMQNSARCERSLRIQIPEKASPAELGLGGDQRKLGIELATVRIRPLRSAPPVSEDP